MTAKLTIATGMCLDAKGEESVYTQMGAAASSSAAFQAVYWKCLCVLFGSSRRHNPEARHVVYTNSPSVPAIAGCDLQDVLDRMEVEVVTLPFDSAPPLDFYDRWRNTFYIFDIVNAFAKSASDGDQLIVNDTDCIYIRSAADLSAAIARTHCLAYDVEYPVEKVINGHSRSSLQALYHDLGMPTHGPVEHYGAEIFAADTDALSKLLPELELLWQEMLRRHCEGLPHFNTEEQFFSYLFTKLGYPSASANPYIRRIWTGFKMNTARPSDFELTTWHMPNEKRYGLTRLFEQVKRPGSMFWQVAPGQEFARYVARFLGVPAPTPTKILFDAFDRAIAKFAPVGA